MARRTAFAAVAYLTGLLLASFVSLWLSMVIGSLFLCVSVCVFVILRPDKETAKYRCGFCAAACGVGLLLYSGYDYFVCLPVTADSTKHWQGEMVICESTVYSEDSAFYTGKAQLPCGLTGKVGFYSTNTELVFGDRITLSGVLAAPENTSFFDTKDHYRSQSVFLLLDDVTEIGYEINENSIFRIVSKLRGKVISVMRRYVPSAEGELLIGMVFGSDYWNMPESVERHMYKSGIGHIAVVSGLHMSIMAGMISGMLGMFSCSSKVRFPVITAAAVLFAVSAGFSPSVIRSAVMIVIVYAADIFKRRSDPLTSLGIAVIILTVTSPFEVRNASFMLSVSGVFGAAVVSPAAVNEMAKLLKKTHPEREMRSYKLLSAVISAVCTYTAIFPAAAMCFDEISVISPVVNLLLSPLCTLAASAAMLGALICMLIGNAGGGIFLAAGLICRPVLEISELAAKQSFSAVPAGIDIIPPLLILIIITAAVSYVLLDDRLYCILASTAAVFASSCMITIYTNIPENSTDIAVLTEGNGSVIVISDDFSSQIYDFCGSAKGVKAAYSYITRSGTVVPCTVVLTEKYEFLSSVYKGYFPDITVISSQGNDGLTYGAENDIIKIGACEAVPCENYWRISAGGAEIVCVLRKSEELPECNIAVLNCIAEADIKADICITAEKRYKGGVSPSGYNLWCTTGEFSVSDGKITVREGIKWLR